MTYELWILLSMGILPMLLGYIPGVAKIQANDAIASKNFNRDNFKPLTGKGARAQRALDNLYENLPAFIVIVMLVHVTGSYNEWTALGASLFLASRLIHPIFYIFGRPFLRSGSYMLGVVGIVMMALQLQ